MQFGRIGGALVVGGWALFVVMGAIFVGGGSVGLGALSIGGLVLDAALALIGSGAVVLSVTGPKPFNGRAVRIGLGILAVGLLVSLASAIMAGASENDALESIPMVVLLLVGGLATVIGAVVTVLALLLTRGPSRVVGSVLLASLGLLILAWILANGLDAPQLDAVAAVLAASGGVGIVLGGIGVGALAIDGSRTVIALAA